jgi:hypothetical protein
MVGSVKRFFFFTDPEMKEETVDGRRSVRHRKVSRSL